MSTDIESRGRGRPRDPRIEAAILAAANRRLADDGYSRMTTGDIAADAGVTRPTVYRRWPNKQCLVEEALDHSFRAELERNPPLDLDTLSARDAITAEVRRLDSRCRDLVGLKIMANAVTEAEHTPGLLELVRAHSLEPRLARFRDTLCALQARGDLRADLDLEVLADMCVGAYFTAYVRGNGDEDDDLAQRIADTVWRMVSAP